MSFTTLVKNELIDIDSTNAEKIAELSEESQTALKYYLENLLLQKEVSDLNRKLTNEQIEKAVYQIAYTWLKNQWGEIYENE